jgi:hypothetical protein
MSNKKTMELEITSPGILPSKLAHDAAAVLEGNERVGVSILSNRATLRAVWQGDADLAVSKIQKEPKVDLKTSAPRVVYLREASLMEPVMKVEVRSWKTISGM